jgi:hypothetical protein
MHRIAPVALAAVVCLSMRADDPAKAPVTAASATAATTPAAANVNPDEIIQKFAAKEKEFSKARENYTYRQTAKLQELDESGNPEGRWEVVEDVIFSPDGKRTEHVVYAPVPSLSHILLTPEDEQDLRNVQPFVLTSDQIGEYDIRYLGKQNADEIPAYVFSVKPKKLEKGKRYFEGQIWVDDRDFQIVKTYGKGVGFRGRGDDNQFPKFETLREQIDGKYWFPTYTHADDTLHFKDGPQRIRMIVTYKDYKKFEGKSTIHFGDVVDDSKPTPPPPPKK